MVWQGFRLDYVAEKDAKDNSSGSTFGVNNRFKNHDNRSHETSSRIAPIQGQKS